MCHVRWLSGRQGVRLFLRVVQWTPPFVWLLRVKRRPDEHWMDKPPTFQVPRLSYEPSVKNVQPPRGIIVRQGDGGIWSRWLSSC